MCIRIRSRTGRKVGAGGGECVWGACGRGGAQCGREAEAACEERVAGDGERFFIDRARSWPMSERKRMVKTASPLTLVRRCALLNVARSTAYYEAVPVSDDDLVVIRQIDKIHLRLPFYGSRQIRDELEDQGHPVNRKRVQRLMRQMGLRALYPRPRTSHPGQGHKIYPYLLKDVSIERPNQVWATDICYIPMAQGSMYLVAIMDWATRRVLSWRVSNTMDSDFCVEALEALRRAGDIQHRPGGAIHVCGVYERPQSP